MVSRFFCVSAICYDHSWYLDQSRIKRSARHKAFWHAKKLNKADDSPLTDENKQFLQSYIDKKYSGPLKEVIISVISFSV